MGHGFCGNFISFTELWMEISAPTSHSVLVNGELIGVEYPHTMLPVVTSWPKERQLIIPGTLGNQHQLKIWPQSVHFTGFSSEFVLDQSASCLGYLLDLPIL